MNIKVKFVFITTTSVYLFIELLRTVADTVKAGINFGHFSQFAGGCPKHILFERQAITSNRSNKILFSKFSIVLLCVVLVETRNHTQCHITMKPIIRRVLSFLFIRHTLLVFYACFSRHVPGKAPDNDAYVHHAVSPQGRVELSLYYTFLLIINFFLEKS